MFDSSSHALSAYCLPLLAVTLLALPAALSAQDRGNIEVSEREEQGIIEITEPAEWRGVEPRGIKVTVRNAVRVVGRAYHPAGVNGVLINGDRAALQELGGGMARFIGYVKVEHETRDVEVAAFTNDGRTFVQRFAVQPEPADQVYQAPDEAWAPDNGFGGKRWAVIVGVSEYADGRITPLRYADRDARAFYDFLTSERAGLGGIPRENVVLLLNKDATYRNLRTALFSFLREATEDDQVIIYFAGHGVPDPERIQDLYLVTHDARVDNLSGTAFPMEDVTAATRNILARDIVVITDACHSAGVGGQVAALRDISANQINRIFLQELNASAGGLTIFTASQAAQVSFEGDQWGGGHGIFTHYLLDGLNGAADEDRDRIVTLVEMMEYTRERVRRETRNAQIPTISQTTFDQALPMAAVLDPSVYDRLAQEETAQQNVALPSMFAVPEPAAPVNLYDPGAALIRGLTLPGAGMFYVDRSGLGAVYAAGTLGAFFGTFGLLKFADNASRYENVEEWFPLAIAPAGVIWVIGAFHARGIANRQNAEAEALRRGSLDIELLDGVRLTGPRLDASAGGFRLEVARLQF